ncbi:Origin of replication complex subunit 3 [Linum grandiflorum]
MESFSVLHKASCHKAEKISSGTGKTKAKKRIDLTTSEPASSGYLDASSAEFNEYHYLNVRMEAFDAVWARIESSIKDVLRKVNAAIFSEIHQWVRDSFDSLVSLGIPTVREATQPFPILKDATSKQIFTGLILTRNVEFVDDLMAFEDLGLHLKSQGCHVAKLSSLDFSAKNGVGGCLRSLLRQFLIEAPDMADISMLATWYKEQGNSDNPVVIILDDMERCCPSVLSNFIHMLSEWVLKVPVILIMGVATTIDAPRNVLPSSALHRLHAQKFTLQSLSEKMNALLKTVFLKQCSEFTISHRAAVLLRNYFVNQDGTMTSFIRALKIACAQHFSSQPLCFIINWFLHEDDNEVPQGDIYGFSEERMLKLASDLPSWNSDGDKTGQLNGETLVRGLLELKKLQRNWRMVVLCLYEVVEGGNVQLLDLLCEALDSKGPFLAQRESESTVLSSQMLHTSVAKKGIIHQVVRKVRDLPPKQLSKLLNAWEKYTTDVPQIHCQVKELLSLLKLDDGKSSANARRHASRGGHVNAQKNSNTANEKASKLVELMVDKYMCPVECVAFHEVVCFNGVDKLQAALVGDTRRRIQVDLQEFHDIICCSCCRKRGGTLLPSMPDSSIMYSLAQEHGDVVNVHDWYQSFKSIVLSMHTVAKKGKSRSKRSSPSPKKRKTTISEPAKPSEASIQARFCKAIVELQVTGLVKMPSRRRPDYLQRLAFGL